MYIPRLLMLEENAGESRLIASAAQSKGYTIVLETVHTWTECEKYCQVISGMTENEYPNLIIAGEKLSGKNAPCIVGYLRTVNALDLVPVVVYSHCNDRQYVSACYNAGANSYIQKPDGIEESRKKIQNTIEYWFLTNVYTNKHTFNRALQKTV